MVNMVDSEFLQVLRRSYCSKFNLYILWKKPTQLSWIKQKIIYCFCWILSVWLLEIWKNERFKVIFFCIVPLYDPELTEMSLGWCYKWKDHSTDCNRFRNWLHTVLLHCAPRIKTAYNHTWRECVLLCQTYSVSKTQHGHRYSSSASYSVVISTSGTYAAYAPKNPYIHICPKCCLISDYSLLMKSGHFFFPIF